jgi:30S ribosomal protein S31
MGELYQLGPALTFPAEAIDYSVMGKGDRRSKRGKIFQGSSGKTRPKGKTKKKKEQQEKPAKQEG